MQRFLITMGLLLLAGVLTVGFILNGRRATESAAPVVQSPPASGPVANETSTPATPDATLEPTPAPAPATTVPAVPAGTYQVQKITETQPDPVIGSTEADATINRYRLAAQFTPWGGGLRYVKLAPNHVGARVTDEPYAVLRQLDQWQAGLHEDPALSYQHPMSAALLSINGQRITLFDKRWRVTQTPQDEGESVTFELVIEDNQEKPVLKITRHWELLPGAFDLHLSQRFENLSAAPLRVAFTQYGPGELNRESGYMGDMRRVLLGHMRPYRKENKFYAPTADDATIGLANVIEGAPQLWPGEAYNARPEGSVLTWVAVDNRYFTSAIYPRAQKPESIEPVFAGVRRYTWGQGDHRHMVLALDTPPIQLAAVGAEGAAQSLDVAFFTGPKDPGVLRAEGSTYAAMGLGQIIYYNLGSLCAFCTWAWLAEGLLAFLRLLHTLMADWGMAIIGLVAVVRLLLHPITKKSQINMMKAGKQMAALKPEVDKLKKKFESNPQKQNQEMMKLYREKGVNPASMGLGCLPMFLQMPIWIALYAMLFFAIELRHEAAFWGVFQNIGNGWGFLGDMSVPDNFISFGRAFSVFGLFEIDGINLLPILMGLVFYLQQKFTPTPAPQDDQQAMQQKMMKFMVLLFPIFLYKAPCGLNLYILASTTVGIIESKKVRDHLKELEASGKLFESKPRKPGGLMDRLAKAAEAQMNAQGQQGKPNKGKGRG